MKTRKKAAATTIAYEQVREIARPALFFGFVPVPFKILPEDQKAAKPINSKESHEVESDVRPLDVETEEKTALLRVGLERNVQGGQPLMIYQEHVVRTHLSIKLDVIGNNKGVGEALVISTARSIMRTAGVDGMVILNCIGDKDSHQRFLRATGEYYRQHVAELPPSCRQLLKKDILSLISCACEHEKCRALASEAPRSMNFLSEPSRVHFKEVLEYLDSSNIPYMLDDALFPSKGYASHTVFKIISTDEKNPRTYAYGFRYNTLSKKLGHKRELSAVGISILIDKKGLGEPKKKLLVKIPKFFFIHVGTEARLRSIGVLDMLREHGIAIGHGIIKDKLSAQLAQAEESKAPYILLMGQKECIEGTVMVRNTTNRSQEAISIADLPAHLKKLK